MTRRWAALAALLTLSTLASIDGAEDLATNSVQVWEGYLWKDKERRVRLGWVYPMSTQTMWQKPHVIELDPVGTLSPFIASSPGDVTFLGDVGSVVTNCLGLQLRVLARLRGTVVTQKGDGSDASSRSVVVMHNPRLLTVEFLSDEWLKALASAGLNQYIASVWRNTNREEVVKLTEEVVPKVLMALKSMRAFGSPAETQREMVRRVDQEARVVQWFRQDTESELKQLIESCSKEFGIKVEGLDKLGPFPPSGDDVQRLFLEAKNKQAFLKAIRGRWPMDPEGLELPSYDGDQRTAALQGERVDEVASAWTDEIFARRQEVTRRVLGETRKERH